MTNPTGSISEYSDSESPLRAPGGIHLADVYPTEQERDELDDLLKMEFGNDFTVIDDNDDWADVDREVDSFHLTQPLGDKGTKREGARESKGRVIVIL